MHTTIDFNQKILKTLNSSQNNLDFFLKNDHLIEIYLKMLGLSLMSIANLKEIVFPEIERLLTYYEKQCTFQCDGIYINERKIMSIVKEKQEIKMTFDKKTCRIINENPSLCNNKIIVQKCLIEINVESDIHKILYFLPKSIQKKVKENNMLITEYGSRTIIIDGIEIEKEMLLYLESTKKKKMDIFIKSSLLKTKPIIEKNIYCEEDSEKKYMYYYGNKKIDAFKDYNLEKNFNYKILYQNIEEYQNTYPELKHPLKHFIEDPKENNTLKKYI